MTETSTNIIYRCIFTWSGLGDIRYMSLAIWFTVVTCFVASNHSLCEGKRSSNIVPSYSVSYYKYCYYCCCYCFHYYHTVVVVIIIISSSNISISINIRIRSTGIISIIIIFIIILPKNLCDLISIFTVQSMRHANTRRLEVIFHRLHITLSLSSVCKIIRRHWIHKMLVSYTPSTVSTN